MTYENCPSCGTAIGDGWCRACDAESDRINRPEAGAVPKPSARDWTEDFGHENGNYESICWRCGDTFIGHKRRVACKVCASSATQDTDRLCTEIAETAGAIDATEERTPMPDAPGSDALLPCPFCGSEAHHGIVEQGGESNPDFGGHFVQCTNENCYGCVGLRFACGDDPKPELVEAWNRRAPDGGATALLRYLYAEAGVRLNELGAGEPLRIAYATLRKDIRKWAERFGVEMEG
jgi:hypothetical protein